MTGQPQSGSNPFVTFDVTNLTVSEPGLPASTVIERTRPFQVAIDFVFAGMLSPWLVCLSIPCDVEVTAESIGPGPEASLGTITVTTTCATPPVLNYTGTVSVPANTLPAGRYRIVGAVTVHGTPPPGIAGYVEGPILQIT